MDPVIGIAATVKEGSYFVYADSATQAQDSFRVIQYHNDSLCDDYRGNAAQYISYTMRNEHHFDLAFTTGHGITGFLEPFGRVQYLWFPFTPGSMLGPQVPQDSLYDYQLTKYHSALNLQGNTYKNVYEIRSRSISANKLDTNYVYTFYSAENGLVKYSTQYAHESRKTWELKSSHINR